jgi:hypothetical protein
MKMGEIDVTFGFFGAGCWQNFCRPNHDIISAKKAVRFGSKRDDWCRYDNFSDMYDDVYGRLHEMGIAEKLSEAVWRDRDNNIVTEADAYGQKMADSLIPTQAHNLIMVDEVGENISQKGDGNAGGQKFMVTTDMRAQVRNSFKDNNFTVLFFTAVTGGPVMCAIIIMASKLKVTDVTGYNPLYVDARDVISYDMKQLEEKLQSMKDEHSNGVYQMFPFGPMCTFLGVKVPTFVTCSKHGSIMIQLLTKILQTMDTLCLFDRSDGTNPCLLCDGHGSRFEEPILSYTLESSTPWGCCIGLTYGTSLWHVNTSGKAGTQIPHLPLGDDSSPWGR